MAKVCEVLNESTNHCELWTDLTLSNHIPALTLADIQVIAPYIVLLFVVVACFKALFLLPKTFIK